ncbi:hypothetical protein PUN28_010395 [Cardiocondyla obscurior]|uniref:Tudor domain-containing protein n=1 Tax=Cardiocondyla obscurior TaxID=286306 RepID=A0AAW2FQ48_9HYME
MTQQLSSELVIFVTHVEPDDIYLKIWGQTDKQAATTVEHYIYPLIEQFKQGYGCPSKANRLIVGTLCCARFQTEGYYRAKVLNIRSDGMIVVQFIDYGNVEILPPNEIHLLNTIPGTEPLQTYPAMASEFILMNVLPINGVWDNRTIEGIRKILCYNEYRAFIEMVNNHCMIKLCYNNEDLSELLVRDHMALPATVQDMFRPKHTMQLQMLQQVSYQQRNKGNVNNFTAMPIMPNLNVNHNANMQGLYHKTFSPNMNQKCIAQPIMQHPPAPPPPPPPLVQEALMFKSRVLDVGSSHEVLISFVEDGPQKFSVQVESAKPMLSHLMREINNHPKQPLQEPPLPGSVCLGRFKDPAGHSVLCRTVVMSVMEHKCKLYYVDFGHTEVLPYTDIFQLPPEYINPKVLSIRFTLSGLKELNITDEMKTYFKNLVYRRLLVLHVCPPEGPPLIQYGDLYDNGINVKDILKKAFPAPTTTMPIIYSYPQLQRLSKDIQTVVYVSYVESCKKFFVQLDNGIKSLESIMVALTQYAKTASSLNITQLKSGLPCAALYDSQWYRAEILGIVGDKVKVVYVDYGNEEVLPVVALRTIHNDLVVKLPAQAIRCALNGYDVLSLDQEVSNHFEKLTLEKRFYMKVVASQSDGLLVDLFEFETMRSVHPQLLNNLYCDKTENSSSSQDDVQHSKTNEFQSEDKDKYGKKNNPNTWNRNQNTKFFQDSKVNTRKGEWSQEKQYDRRDRAGAYSHRESIGSQNDRFMNDKVTNNRFDRDKSYNDEGDGNTFNRSNRGNFRDGGNKFTGNEKRYNRNSSFDKANSDKDSDTSSKGNDRWGKSSFKRNSFNDSQGGNRDSRTPGRQQTTTWSDRKPATAHRTNYKNEKFNGDFNNKYRNKDDDTNNILQSQTIECKSWNTQNISGGIKSKLLLMKIDIVLGSIKNCEVVFINNPLDFFIQLNPDCLELDSLMESIAAVYENGGEPMQISEIQNGTYCITQYSEDLKWYRAVIKSVEENSATVEFVDYGNTESVDLMKIKVISEEFLKLPMQAVHCKLFGLTNTDDEKYAIFLEKAEEKPLQVEFVSEKNGMYEVLLCEVVDDVPNTNYINEEFCGISDLIKAKQGAANKKSLKTMAENKPALDYTPPDFKWQTTLHEPETKQDVVVTWFINPNKLYCQLLSEETKFKTMMSEIQKTYADRKPVTYKPQVGSAVVAIFSEDKALYRAEVMSIETRKDAYVVQYVDFGNCAVVNQRNIYPVEEKFTQLPKLAVQCSLKNIVPSDNKSNWSEVDNNALDNCFNADKYECIFHNFANDQYIISLNRNGQDVSTMLVQQNLAVFTTETLIQTNEHDTKVKELNDVERVDISLLNGQTLRMRISSVENAAHFYVQLPSASKCESIVDQYMADKNAKALALPGELAVMQNQALECSLKNVSASSDTDKQLKEFETKEVLVYVEEVNNSRLIVKLYDLLGNGILNEEKISPVCPMPILSSTHKVSVSYADCSTNIWLQRFADVEIETKLSESLQEYYTNLGQKLEPEVHMLCAAKYSDDEQWYRGKIVSLTETAAYVNYIDYGNTEEVALDSIMILEPQFYEPHQLAINASLSVSLIGPESEQKNILQTHLMNKDLVAVFYNVHNKWIVDLIEDEEKLSDRFRSLNLVTVEQTASESAAQITQVPTSDRFDVCVSHVDSPSQFWLQRTDKISILNEKQDQLQLEVSNFMAIDGVPEEGTLCVAIYSFDDLWYRAEVLDADKDITTVRFIDYGNTDIINNANSIRQMPDAWKNLGAFASKCRLDIIPVDTEDWSESTCERLKTLIMSTESLQALLVADTVPKRVELFIDDKSVSEMLVEEKHAIKINTEQEPVDEIVDLELDPHSAFVCHVNSPSEFWVQEEKSVADLEVMADRFMVADMFPKIDNIKEDLLCVAKFPEDDQWYRARVISHDENGTQVIYIDYGNSAVSIEIRAIPEDLANIPPLSRKCCLELPAQVEKWSEQAHEEFVKLAADGATIFHLDVLKEQETSLVKLTLDGQNVVDILGSLCEQSSPIIEERLPPLGEENSPNVMVSYINSPSEFWIQAESSISELEVMTDRLQDAESFLALNNLDVGMVCAARYPEDQCWYRAKIIARCQEGIEVLYMDFGNSAITEELRRLPEDIVNIPTLSKRCTLEKSNNRTWSERACNKFKELAAEGATMFQFEILDENDPMHVRLNLNGTNVIDLLYECENNILEDNTQQINEETSNLNKSIQQNNPDYVSQLEKLEIDKTDCNEKSDIDETCESSKDLNQDQSIVSCNKIKNLDGASEIVAEIIAECTSKLEENNSVAETNESIVSNASASTSFACFKAPPSAATELSVDEIIQSLITDATDKLESQIVDKNSLSAHEIQQNVVQNEENKPQEQLLSQIQSIDIHKSSDTQISDNIKTDIKNLESNDILSVTTESQSHDVKEEKREIRTKEPEESDANKNAPECETLQMALRLSEEQLNLEQIQEQNLTTDQIISETTNNDLETQFKSTDVSNDFSSESICTADSSAIKTDPIEPCSYSEKRLENKDGLDKQVSESKLPNLEENDSMTPKTSHSEEIVGAVVNPYVQSALDSTNENNEVLTISVENNIPT